MGATWRMLTRYEQKNGGERRQPVELVVEEDNDLGIGSREFSSPSCGCMLLTLCPAEYWKGASQPPPPSQSQSMSQSQPKSSTTLKSTQRSARIRPSLVSDDEDEDEPVPKPTKGKGKSQAKSQSKPPSTQSRSSVRSTRAKSSQKQPLFIDSDIEEGDELDDDLQMGLDDDDGFGEDDDFGEDEPVATLKSTRETQPSAKGKAASKKKAPAIVVDDDSDDGATFKAIGSRTRSRR